MYSTAMLLANGHFGDLLAEADRERLADEIRRSRKASATGRALFDWLRNRSRRILRTVRAEPHTTAR